MALVAPLHAVGSASLATVGGKALNLGLLTAAGFPVPRGFVVTTAAYALAVGARTDALLAELSTTSDPGSVAGQLRTTVLTAPVPDEVRHEVLAGYRALGPAVAVAVRSSATAEDLAFASFAGQQDTFLNVVGDDAVVDAVRRCWASLWTDRALDYRAQNGIDQRTVRLAVVVQEMVEARTAGVLFTADPVTGTRRHSVVEASPGLGEAVVSGAVNPDRFVVDTPSGRVLDRRLGDKRVLIRSVPGGGVERVEQPSGADRPSLTDAEIRELTELGRQVQVRSGSPQDLEWAVDTSGRVWLTQSRAITTLYPLPDGAGDGAGRAYLCLSLAQGLVRPITPMGLAAFRLVASSVASVAGRPPPDPVAGPAAYRPIGQRLFVDITGVLRNPLGRRAALAVLGVMEARAAAVVAGLGADPRWALRPRSALAALRPVARVVLTAGVPWRVLQAVASPGAAHRAVDGLEARLRATLPAPPGATATERLDHVQRSLSGPLFLVVPRVGSYAGAGFLLLALARRLLADLARPGDLQTVLRGLPHNVTTEMDLELWRLADRIRADQATADTLGAGSVADLSRQLAEGRLPATAQTGITGFLHRYGVRAVAEIDLGLPRWSEDPSHLLGVVQNYLRPTADGHSPAAQFADAAASAEAMIDALTRRARGRSRVRGVVVGLALHRGRELAGLRERPKFLLVLVLAGMREQLRLVGEALAEGGRVATPDDVFFLDLPAARRGLAGDDLSALVAQRREAYAGELRRRHVPRLLLSDGTEPEAVGTAGTAEGALRGSPASAGLVSAPARVVLDPVGARLEPGEVLVAPSTDPGWTPLFLTAGGLVMEMGGSNSHGAVVAREYGIPAVVGVPDATIRISTGQRVRVDGAAGSVVLLDN